MNCVKPFVPAVFPVDTSIDPARLGLQLEERLQQRLRPALATVINATGVILHTNLGRAPLSAAAQESLSAVSGQYTNLEYDVRTGCPVSSRPAIEPLLKEVLRL